MSKTPNNFEEDLREVLTGMAEKYQSFDDKYKKQAIVLSHLAIISTLCEEELLLRDLNSRIGEITRAYRFGYITKNYYERAKARNLKLYQENFKRLAELKGKE